jgi:hypothetical protein
MFEKVLPCKGLTEHKRQAYTTGAHRKFKNTSELKLCTLDPFCKQSVTSETNCKHLSSKVIFILFLIKKNINLLFVFASAFAEPKSVLGRTRGSHSQASHAAMRQPGHAKNVPVFENTHFFYKSPNGKSPAWWSTVQGRGRPRKNCAFQNWPIYFTKAPTERTLLVVVRYRDDPGAREKQNPSGKHSPRAHARD